MAAPLPRVLVLGGSGFIGRHVVAYLVENKLASKIRVADKIIPATAFLAPRHKAAVAHVDFVQCNLAREATVAKAFTDADGEFSVVLNCAGMTKNGQEPVVYEENIVGVTATCAREAARRGIRFIEVSTAQVYSADKKPSTEDAKVKPWTLVAEYKLKAEGILATIEGLNYCIVRPAIVYGVSDMLGLTPRLIVGAVYKKTGETMKTLWTKELRLNTVHVEDVARALWHVALHGARGRVYNVADKGDSTQESINMLVARLFGIEVGYVGSIMSNLAKLKMADVTEDINEQHMGPWADMCRQDGIENSPLSPYLDQELLYNNSTCVDGSAIEATGFVYNHPVVTVESLRECVGSYIEQKLFPNGYLA